MTCFRKTAGILIMFAAVFGVSRYAEANYRFDDLYGPSGISFQWMVLNDSYQTFGGSHKISMDVSGDLLTTGEAVLRVLTGESTTPLSDRNLNTMFWVLAGSEGDFAINFGSPEMQFDVPTGDIALGTPTGESRTSYYSTKESLGQSRGKNYYNALWRAFRLNIFRNSGSPNGYDTVRQVFNFHQNPSILSSQTIYRPVIIANVVNGTAADVPLEIRMTLRDSPTSAGNIVAYNWDEWDVTSEKYTGDEQWLFVPVEDLNVDNSPVYYYLTTEVVNHTSTRYATQDYGYSTWATPLYWKFDLARYQGTTDIISRFNLDPASHIAPGLVTVYQRRYNINEQNKRPLRLFAVDDNKRTAMLDLILNHRVVFGKKLGDKVTLAAQQGNFNLYEITAYQPRPADMNFYKKVAQVTNSTFEEVSVPTSSVLAANSVTHNASTMPSDAIQYFTINQQIPGNLRKNIGRDGMMPLHITINLPVTLIDDRDWWNDMLNEWRSSGTIADIFAEKFDICLLTQTDGQNNPWNLSQELREKGVYADQIKVFFDEERGRATQDNDRGLVTISFIVMLMDGTRDGKLPELSIVEDSTTNQANNYIVIRDGNEDNRWNMTFFIAPAGDYVNVKDDKPNNTQNTDSSSGGGGCNAGFGVLFVTLCGILFVRKNFEGR